MTELTKNFRKIRAKKQIMRFLLLSLVNSKILWGKMKYVSENSFEQINLEGFHIDCVKIINNQLHLRYEYIEILPENPQNPFDSIHCTNEAKLILYDFEVQNSGYYDCSSVKKQQYVIEKECTFIPINICNLLNDFTTVSVYKRDEPFEYYFAGFAHNFNGNWGCCTMCFKRMDALWDSFY